MENYVILKRFFTTRAQFALPSFLFAASFLFIYYLHLWFHKAFSGLILAIQTQDGLTGLSAKLWLQWKLRQGSGVVALFLAVLKTDRWWAPPLYQAISCGCQSEIFASWRVVRCFGLGHLDFIMSDLLQSTHVQAVFSYICRNLADTSHHNQVVHRRKCICINLWLFLCWKLRENASVSSCNDDVRKGHLFDIGWALFAVSHYAYHWLLNCSLKEGYKLLKVNNT